MSDQRRSANTVSTEPQRLWWCPACFTVWENVDTGDLLVHDPLE